MAGVNEVIMRLLADTKQYTAEIDKTIKKNVEFGDSTVPMSQKINNFTKQATTAVAGLGLAMGAYGVDQAIKFTETLDQLRNQSGASASEIEYLKGKILDLSSLTGIASGNISSAFLSVEKAGIRGKSAVDLVTAASKAAVATGGDVVQMTQAIIAAQTIQSAKGMSVAQVADLMVIANKHHIGSLDNLVAVLQGKVGGTLAAYGVNLAQSAAIADVASEAGYSNARAMVALANGIGKVENPTKSSSKQLASMGINANKLASEARSPGGIISVLKDLEVQSRKTGIPMDSLIKSVFGQGAGLASVLDKNLPKLTTLVNTLSSASGKNLNTVFGISQSQLDNQIKILKTNLQNALTGLGLLLLPTVEQVAHFATGAVKYFRDHPLVSKFATDATIGLFAIAIGKKVYDVLKPVLTLLGSDFVTGIISKLGPLGILATGGFDVYKTFTDPLGFLNPSGGTPIPKAPKGTQEVPLVDKQGNATKNYVAITQAQINALNKLSDSPAFQKLGVGRQSTLENQILKQFARYDASKKTFGKTTITVRVTP